MKLAWNAIGRRAGHVAIQGTYATCDESQSSIVVKLDLVALKRCPELLVVDGHGLALA